MNHLQLLVHLRNNSGKVKNFGTQITEKAEREYYRRLYDAIAFGVFRYESTAVAEQQTDGKSADSNDKERQNSIEDVDWQNVFLSDFDVAFKHFEKNLKNKNSFSVGFLSSS